MCCMQKSGANVHSLAPTRDLGHCCSFGNRRRAPRRCRPRQFKGLAGPTRPADDRRCHRTSSRVEGPKEFWRRAYWQKRCTENLDLAIANAVPCHYITKRAALQVSSAFPFALQHSWKTTSCQPSSFTTRAGFLCRPAFAESLD